MGPRTAAPALALATTVLGGCASPPPDDAVRLVETSVCVYDAERGGMVGSYVLEGAGDAHVAVFVVKGTPSTTPLLGSRGWLVRDGDYQARRTYLVPLDREPRSSDRVTCRVEIDEGPADR